MSVLISSSQSTSDEGAQVFRRFAFLDAVLTVGFTFFFGSENLPAQVMMTGVLSVLVFIAYL